MMKKLLLLSSVFLLSQVGTKAQNAQTGQNTVKGGNSASKVLTASTPTVVQDTLSYFFNKQFFKIPVSSPPQIFPYYKEAAATNTLYSHMGSVFLNNDPNLMVDGIEARVAIHNSTNNLQIPIRLYLCNVNASLIPVFPPVDSITVIIGAAQSWLTPMGHPMGGNFMLAGNPNPHNMPTNFAVLVRNMSLFTGDTVRLFRTASRVPGSVGSTTNTNMGEGLGVIRVGGNFIKTTNYNNPAFGVGTDYEFCVAPRVTYTLIADHIVPPKVDSQPVDTVKCWEALTFTNTSTPHWTNRFFNLTEFYRHFVPYANTPGGGFPADSAISWYFDDEDLDYPNLRPNIVLKNGAITATKWYDTVGCFTSCSMRARLKKMTAGGTGDNIQANIAFSLCVSCWESGVGVKENTNLLNSVTVYPNPTSSSKVTISGLKGKNTIHIYDMLGQLVSTQVTTDDKLVVDLLKESRGNFIIKITDENNHYKSVKIINQKE